MAGVHPTAGPGEVASAHVASESGGQNSSECPQPTGGHLRRRGRFGGAFLNTRLEKILPALADYLEATAIADVPGLAGPTPEEMARVHDLVERHLGRQVADQLRRVSRERVLARPAPKPI
jgi:hypothetical protein